MAGAGKEYVLGRGKLYFDPFPVNSTVGSGELYFGNTPETNYSISADTLDHYDADEGLNVLDEQVQTKVDMKGALKVDNVSLDNIALFLQAGSKTTVVVASGTGLSQTIKVKKGAFYQIGASDSLPSGARNVTVTAAVVGATNVLAQLTIDGPMGRFSVKSDAADIDDGDDVVLTYNVAAGNRELVISKDQQIRGALRFISDNPVGGQRDYYWPYVLLVPNGDYALKGDSWQEMSFNFTALKRSATVERLYVDGRAA